MTSSDFIGRGWRFPPGVNSSGGIAMSSGAEEIENAMRMILLTAPGERVMRPEFGCRIWDFVFHPLGPNTIGEMRHAVQEALQRWEPRVAIEQLDVAPAPQDGAFAEVSIHYRVLETNDRRNLVLPFYEIGEEPAP
ncbi:MAG: GPW/gp25 family protein [Chloroflexi bacterium]|nr:GPW/gp25 family protein [Chloroflexota bacterium]MDA1002298.1 GPW/gp25 family protein [Chloroflexota bacterium]